MSERKFEAGDIVTHPTTGDERGVVIGYMTDGIRICVEWNGDVEYQTEGELLPYRDLAHDIAVDMVNAACDIDNLTDVFDYYYGDDCKSLIYAIVYDAIQQYKEATEDAD